MDDIDIITETITGVTRGYLLAHPDYDFPPLVRRRLIDALRRYRAGEPCAYILGEASFFGLNFRVGPGCLIPRGDTEFLAERTISLLPENGCFADLCTGSGCVAVSVLANMPDVSCLAVDNSDAALRYAAQNAERHRVKRRMVLLKGDVFQPSILMGYTFDLIVANPPYIPSSEIDFLDESVKKEPREALDGGKDGLDFYRCFLSQYGIFLNKGGSMLFEIGYDQGEAIKNLSIENGAACTIYKDYSGHDRVAKITPVVL